MFRKRFKPLVQDIPDPIEHELRAPLNEVIEKIETELKDSNCAILKTLPLVPLRAKELKMDGRLFTPDTFDAVGLLKHLSRSATNPINSEPLEIKDIGPLLEINQELIKKIDEILEKNYYSREDLLKFFGVSKETYQFLLKTKFEPYVNLIRVKKRRRPVPDVEDEVDSNFLNYVILAFLVAALVSLLIYLSKNVTCADAFNAVVTTVNYLYEKTPQVLKILKDVPIEFITILYRHSGLILNTTIFAMKQIELMPMLHVINPLQYDLRIPAAGVTTALVARESFQLAAKNKYWSKYDDNAKLLRLLTMFCMLLLGADALTDCLGVVSAMTPAGISKEIVGFTPLVSTAISGFFGKMSSISKVSNEFQKLMKNGYSFQS